MGVTICSDSFWFPNTASMQPFTHMLTLIKMYGITSAHSPTFPSLRLRHSSFSSPSAALPTSQLILQSFRCFTYVTAHSPSFRCFTYVTAHSPTLPPLYLRHSSFSILPLLHVRHSSFSILPLLHLRHSSFSNPSAALPTSQIILHPFVASSTSHLILQPFRRFTYVTAHSPSFRCFTYVIVHSPTLLSLLLRHKLFDKFTWRAAHDYSIFCLSKTAEAMTYTVMLIPFVCCECISST